MNQDIRQVDSEIYQLIRSEEKRQRDTIRLIPSENYASLAVMQATGSVLTNKYSEGYPGARYYEGQQFVDQIERLACKRACSLFGAEHANVQAYSGSPANLAVYYGLLEPHDKLMGMHLLHGGHLTHGWKVNFSAKYYTSIQYPVDAQTELIDYAELRKLARAVAPKLIVAGATAYPRIYDFDAFAEIAQEVGACLLVDISHIAGLVAGGAHPNPVPVADVVMTTSHKSLRGPRGAIILCKEKHAKAIDRAVFPGLQGGPHNHTTAGIAVSLKEASQPDFKEYAKQIVLNAKALADGLLAEGLRLISGGTDTHLILIDLRPLGMSGRDASKSLDRAGIETNCNSVPYDTRKPFDPSGVRVGTPAVTSRGMKAAEMNFIAKSIARIIKNCGNKAVENEVLAEVKEFVQGFPAPSSVLGDE